MSDIKKGIVGVAGEFFVAAELSQLGIVATLTLKNTPSIDILATNLQNGSFANIQVKTMSINNHTGWRLGRKDEEPSGIQNHYYVFVNLQGIGQVPEYIIIPQLKIAEFIRKTHYEWLTGTKKDGSKRKDTDIRVFNPFINTAASKFAKKYINSWEILELW
jgi:hypothetical protein